MKAATNNIILKFMRRWLSNKKARKSLGELSKMKKRILNRKIQKYSRRPGQKK